MLAKEPYGPQGDPECHLSLRELQAGHAGLATAEADAGRLNFIVRRLPDGSRDCPDEAMLTVEEGLVGDGWSRRPPRDPQAQLAVMRSDIAALIANGQSLELFGDNLFVELDLRAGSLPIGSELQVGQAIVVMSPEPHNGCAKFHERFGPDALRFVQASATRDQNLRGVYWRVIRDGLVKVGSPIRVLSRP